MTDVVPTARGTGIRSARHRLRDAAPRLAVVIPARDEERRLPRCLAAMEQAERSLRSTHPGALPSRIVVVLDRCTDGSRDVLMEWPSIETVSSDHGRVGAARAAGVEAALSLPDGLATPSWVACTDADSVVPADWLITHFEHALAGTELLLGLVRPDPAELSVGLLESWKLAHRLADGHPHVHGANFGISADMYKRAGGFADVAVHEDVLLATRVRELGGRVVSTSSSPVRTSARLSGRAPSGMADFLTALTALTAGTDRDETDGVDEAIAS